MILGGEVGRVERDAEVGGATFPRSDGDGKRRTSAGSGCSRLTWAFALSAHNMDNDYYSIEAILAENQVR